MALAYLSIPSSAKKTGDIEENAHRNKANSGKPLPHQPPTPTTSSTFHFHKHRMHPVEARQEDKHKRRETRREEEERNLREKRRRQPPAQLTTDIHCY